MWPSIEEVHRAAVACGKRKRNRADAIRFRLRYGEEILDLTQRLQTGTYRPEPGTVFIVNRPKFREIHAAHFRDRVVHHLIHQQLESVFEKSFIADSYACRKGRGTLAAVQALQRKMRQITRNNQVRAYALQLDVKAFFPSIHKQTLLSLLDSKRALIPNAEAVLKLARIVVEQDPSQSARKLGNRSRFNRVPGHKRLGSKGPNFGLPIGNLTSQFFGNVYLNALDQFVKRSLGVRHYVRYCDDMVCLHTDPQQLLVYEQKIRSFLKERLKLDLQKSFKLNPVSQGVDFLGYIIRPGYLLPRKRILNNAQNRITELEKNLKPFEFSNYQVWSVQSETIEKLRSSWTSYSGHLKHGDSHRALLRLWAQHPISRFFLSLNRSFKPRFARLALDNNWRQQVNRLSVGIGGAVLMIEVGHFVECPKSRDQHRLGLRRLQPAKGRLLAGFHKRFRDAKISFCLRKNWPVAYVVQDKSQSGGLRVRRLAWYIRLAYCRQTHAVADPPWIMNPQSKQHQ